MVVKSKSTVRKYVHTWPINTRNICLIIAWQLMHRNALINDKPTYVKPSQAFPAVLARNISHSMSASNLQEQVCREGGDYWWKEAYNTHPCHMLWWLQVIHPIHAWYSCTRVRTHGCIQPLLLMGRHPNMRGQFFFEGTAGWSHCTSHACHLRSTTYIAQLEKERHLQYISLQCNTKGTHRDTQ